MTAKITKASYPSHVVTRPSEWRIPYVFSSPHSGREYPNRFLNDSILELNELRKSEDAYVDLLMPKAEDVGAPVISARFPRAFVDVNRGPREIDEFMFTSSPIDGVEVRSNRVLAGFGAIPRYAAEGRAIYAKKLPPAEGKQRLKWCYDPYHDALKGLVSEGLKKFGHLTLIDWHSMPSTSVHQKRNAPDIVLGDRYGASTDPEITQTWERAFRDVGLTVTRNTPYAGGYIVSRYGEPLEKVSALQVEINRRQYLDEAAVKRLSGKFDHLTSALLSAALAATGAPGCFSIAAE